MRYHRVLPMRRWRINSINIIVVDVIVVVIVIVVIVRLRAIFAR